VGEHQIPTLESLLTLVAGSVPLLLEVKVDGDIWRWPAALKRELAGYAERFGVISFDPRIPRLLKTNLPEVRRGFLIDAKLPPFRRRLYRRLADPQFLAIEHSILGQSWVSNARRRIPIYAWTIRTAAERTQSEVHADALIWEGDGGPRI
jgi:glycerophosphoryl diester phosphodiesterase